MNKIRVLTLDLDDTLWEIHPVIRRAERRLYSWLGEHYPKITELYAMQDLFDLRAAIVEEFADRAHDLTFLRRTVLSRVGIAAGCGTDFVDDAFTVFDAARNDVEIFPGVVPALQALRERFVLIALTNGNANLETIGIDHLFHAVVTAESAGAAKPAKQIFDVAVGAGGAAAEQTLHVGDHPKFDVDGARAAGMPTVWVNRNGSEWPAEYAAPSVEVQCVSELTTILA